MKTAIRFEILGEPFGKQRPKFSKVGNFVRAYTPKETVNYESRVVQAYKEKYKGKAFEYGQQIYATITAYFPITKSHYHYHKKTQTLDLDKEGKEMLEGKIRPMKTPDCDNIAKVCLDALNEIAYPDDSQVVALLVLKYYDENPRVEIVLESNRGRVEEDE